MAAFTAEQVGALESITAAGRVMRFTRTAAGVEGPDGRFTAPAPTQIEGRALVVKGAPQEYAVAGLTQILGPTVLFTPTTYPLAAYTTAFVLPGDTTEINGTVLTVMKVLSLVAPDGYVILARIALGA